MLLVVWKRQLAGFLWPTILGSTKSVGAHTASPKVPGLRPQKGLWSIHWVAQGCVWSLHLRQLKAGNSIAIAAKGALVENLQSLLLSNPGTVQVRTEIFVMMNPVVEWCESVCAIMIISNCKLLYVVQYGRFVPKGSHPLMSNFFVNNAMMAGTFGVLSTCGNLSRLYC